MIQLKFKLSMFTTTATFYNAFHIIYSVWIIFHRYKSIKLFRQVHNIHDLH